MRPQREGWLIRLHLRYGAARTERDNGDGRDKAQCRHYAPYPIDNGEY